MRRTKPLSKVSLMLLAAAGAAAIPLAMLHAAPGDGPADGNAPNIANPGNGSDGGPANNGPDDAGPDIRRRDQGDGHAMQTKNLSGTVQQFDLSPEGMPEGLIVQSDGHSVQLNLRPDFGGILASAVAVGDQISVTAFAASDADDKPIYNVLSLTTAKGQKIGGDAPQQAVKEHVEGSVKAINYGHRGEVNGVQLDTGDLVRLSRQAAEQLKPTVGERISADGMGHTMMMGHVEVAASTVNGTEVQAPPSGPPGRGRMRPMNGGPDAGPDSGPGGQRGPGGNGPDGLDGMGGGGGGGQDQPNGPPPPNN